MIALSAACGSFGAEVPASDAGTSPADSGASAYGGADAAPCDGVTCVVASCKALRAANDALPSGIYTVDPDGAGPTQPIQVYCEMDTLGGGWTLIGRSAAKGSNGSFIGWRRRSGDLAKPDQPYSLDVNAAGLGTLTEVLFGARNEDPSSFAWDGPVYRHVVPAGFVNDYGSTGYESPSGAAFVAGDCNPNGGPSMVYFLGRTLVTDHWFFRDNDDDAYYGLYADGWDTNNGTGTMRCTYSGNLHGRQGMIFVR